jgi:Ni/Fe-hydrogenase subunit HybB-like protein
VKDNKEPKKNPLNKWLALINIPLQMGIVIFAFSYLGQWLDGKYPNPGSIYTKVVTLIGVFLAIFLVINQVNKINKNE